MNPVVGNENLSSNSSPKISRNESINIVTYSGDIASEQYGRDRASTHSFDRQDEYPPPPMVKGVSDPNMSSSKTYKSRKRRLVNPIHTNNVQYRGMTIATAASQGNFPVCVLLWGIAAGKHINLMHPDESGCNPMHYAAEADNAEVLGFLNSQTKGYLPNTDTKLVDTRNNQNETPLLRATTHGRINVIKHLLDDGSDAFACDNQGNTIFILTIKNGHLWSLHYILETLRSKFGDTRTRELLEACDCDGLSVMDWACQIGNVNIIEYLIRQGISPLKNDRMPYSPLFYAVKHHRVEACQYLVRLGCDPKAIDSHGQSPYQLAQSMNNIDIINALQSSNSIIPCLDIYRSLSRNINRCIKGNNSTQRNEIGISHDAASQAGSRDHEIRIDMSYNDRSDSSDTVVSVFHEDNSLRMSVLSRNTLTENPDEIAQQRTSLHMRQRDEAIKIPTNTSSSSLNTLTQTPALSSLVSYTTDRQRQSSSDSSDSRSITFSTSNEHRIPALYKTYRNEKYSYAISRMNISRFSYAIGYALLLILSGLGTVLIPFWLWIGLTLVFGLLYRYFDIRSRKGKDRRDKLQELSHSNHAKSSSIALESTSTHSYSSSHRKSSKSNDSSSTFHRFLMARERFLGLYLGSFVNYGLYFAASMILSASDHSMEFAQQLMNEPGSWSSSYSTDDKQSKYSLYSFNGQYYISLSGLNGYINHRRLFVASFVLFIFSGFLWLWVVWLFPDPGIINTRERDFNETMSQSYQALGPPPSNYCPTTLVRKPLRSKYCQNTGAVIARMDHHCRWLNTSIGHGNHRSFIVFLYTHTLFALLMLILLVCCLYDSDHSGDVCQVAGSLVSSDQFYLIVFIVKTFVIVVTLLTLSLEQTYNIFRNITTNERINQKRYSWLVDDDGKLCNRFDRGIWINFLEFWQICYGVDYYNTFSMPNRGIHTVHSSLQGPRVVAITGIRPDATLSNDNVANSVSSDSQNQRMESLSGTAPSLSPSSLQSTASMNTTSTGRTISSGEVHPSGYTSIDPQVSPMQNNISLASYSSTTIRRINHSEDPTDSSSRSTTPVNYDDRI